MKISKIMLICLLLLALISIGVVSATDNLNSTDDLIVQATSDNSDGIVKDEAELYDGDEILKAESDSIVITNDTFTNYFDSEGKISDSVPDGATLDFQGQINASDSIKAIYINKPVNIISSTKDATITLNTVDGNLGKECIANRFIIDNVSSITVSDVVFNRTQVIISDSSNVILNNVKVISDGYSVVWGTDSSYSGVEETPLVKLENIDCFILKDSFIHVYDLGSRLIGCVNVKNGVFDNNTFHIRSENTRIDKRVERIISFSNETYVDSSLNITNNYFEVNYIGFSTSYIRANNVLFENNTYEHPDTSYMVSATGFGFGGSNIIVSNNRVPYLSVEGNGSIYDNTVKYIFRGNGDSLLVYNNTIGSNLNSSSFKEVNIDSNCIIYNNTVNGKVQISGNNVILKDSNMKGIIIGNKAKNVTVHNNYVDGASDRLYGAIFLQSTETYVNNNAIKGDIKISDGGNCEINENVINGTIAIESGSSIIQNNVINAFGSDYAISIISGPRYILNEVSGNKIYSRLYCGDNAVSYDENYLNFIEYNTPSTQINMSVNNTVGIFDYDEITTIIVNMPGIEGNVSVDVNGQEYNVKLVKGIASLVLTKYDVGVNNVTVIYYDALEDVWAIGHSNFTVNKVSYCPVELIYGDIPENKLSNIKFILPDDANGTILVNLTNGFYTIAIEQAAKGRSNVISLPGLIEGNYTISATFTSIKYVTNSTTGNISFVHVPVYKLTADNVVMDYKDGSKYKVLVTKDGKAVGAGEVVKITFNGKTKNVKTDKNGYATLTLDAAPKTYTIKAVCNGITKSSKVTIKNVLKASNVSKKKAKIIKFSATLKTSKGKAIAGKIITFKVNGKVYSAKTNKKGVATVSINNLKVGKYAITLKYGLCTLKRTLTVKK